MRIWRIERKERRSKIEQKEEVGRGSREENRNMPGKRRKRWDFLSL